MYLMTYRKCYGHYYIYKVNFSDLIDKYSFNDNNIYLKIDYDDLKQVEDFQYNRTLT